MTAPQFQITDTEREPRFGLRCDIAALHGISLCRHEQRPGLGHMIVDLEPACEACGDRERAATCPHRTEQRIGGDIVAQLHGNFRKGRAVLGNVGLTRHEIGRHRARVGETMLREQRRNERCGRARIVIGAARERPARQLLRLDVLIERAAFATALHVQRGELPKHEGTRGIGRERRVPHRNLHVTLSAVRVPATVRGNYRCRHRRRVRGTGESQATERHDQRRCSNLTRHPCDVHRAASRYGKVVG